MRFPTYAVKSVFLFVLFLLAGGNSVLAQEQTNDPYVDQQQYLFDVHNLDDAWTYTTGSSDVKVGIYSMTGFIQNHEDLSGSRVLSPQGGGVEPTFDYGRADLRLRQ